MRWPWQKNKAEISPELQKQLDEFHAGLDELKNVAGDLRQTSRDLRQQLGEDVAKERLSGQTGSVKRPKSD